jgi:putative ABC transport system permease protein
VILALALAIGANSTIFSLVNTILLQQLPFDSPERLVWIASKRPDRDDAPFSLPEYMDYREQSQSFEQMAAYGNLGMNLTGSGDAERLQGIRASANFFAALGTKAVVGRTLQPQDDHPGNPRVVVLGHGLWKRRLGGEANILGQRLTLNGTDYEVVGILSPEFIFPERTAELVIPLVPDADPWRHNRSSVNFLRLIGRLNRNVSRHQAEGEMNAICKRLREQFPVEQARDIGVRITDLREALVGNFRQSLWILLGAMGIVLLVMSANLANLMLTRGTTRQREIALRYALGASRARIMRQLLAEGGLLALVGGGLGLILAAPSLRLLLQFAPVDLPRVAEVHVDGTILIWTLAVSILTGMIFSLAPGWQASQVNPNHAIKGAGRGLSEGRPGLRMRKFLVVFEVGLATVLLVTGGLLLKTFARLQHVDPGFNTAAILVARISLPATGYPDRDAVNVLYEKLRARLQRVPGIQSVGVVSLAPMTGLIARVDFTVEGRPPESADRVPVAQYRVVSPGYMRTMSIPVLQGREFTDQDTFVTRPVVLINSTLAQRFFPSGDAIGKQLRIDDNDAEPRLMEIVGVVGDVKQSGLDSPTAYEVYAALPQLHPAVTVWLRANMFWMVRTNQDPVSFVGPFRNALREIAIDVPASSIQPMEQYLSAWIAPRKFNLLLLSTFACAGLLLAAWGIYAVVSYSVVLRTHEIGIRMALGAEKGTILLQIVRKGTILALMGVVVGLATAAALGRVIQGMLFEMGPVDFVTYAAVSGLLLTISTLACYLPARRASRLDPIKALRSE